MSTSHWQKVPLSEIAEVRLGRQRSPKRAVGPNMRPYMRAANVTWKGISLHDVKEMDFTPEEFGTYALRRGDLLLSEASGSASEVGKPAVWNDEVPDCCFQNTLIRVRAPEPLVPFLHLHFYKDALTGEFARAARGVGIHHLGAKTLSDWEIHLPPREEQRRIVETVDSYFTRLDDVAATLERVRRNLKRYHASILKAAVEGRLVPAEAEIARAEGRAYEPASVLLQRILVERRQRWEEAELARMKAAGRAPKNDRWKARYKEPAAPDTATLPPLPGGWCWATSDQLFWFVTSGSRGWAKYYSDSGALFLRIGNLSRDNIALDLAAVQRVRVPEGSERERTQALPSDVLISITADVGMVGVVGARLGDAYVNQHVGLARAVECIHVPYVAWFLTSREGGQRQFAALRRGATKVGLGLDDIRSISIPLPPVAEQQRIISAVERNSSFVVDRTGESNRVKSQLHWLRQSILTAVFKMLSTTLFIG